MNKENNTFFDYFKVLKKGNIIFMKDDGVRWVLGDLILDFYEGKVEHVCVIKTAKYKWELTHIHIGKDELEMLLKDIDNPNKKVCVHRILFGILGESFDIVDATENKKHRYYSC